MAEHPRAALSTVLLSRKLRANRHQHVSLTIFGLGRASHMFDDIWYSFNLFKIELSLIMSNLFIK